MNKVWNTGLRGYEIRMTKEEFDKINKMENGSNIFTKKYLIGLGQFRTLMDNELQSPIYYDDLEDFYDEVFDSYSLSDIEGFDEENDSWGNEIGIKLKDLVREVFTYLEGYLEDIVPHQSCFWDSWNDFSNNEEVISSMINTEVK
jgi:hypothetical protein